MATRLQRYRSKGLGLRIPSVDFTLNKVQSNNYANLSNSIDKMSQLFYNSAIQTAKVEGAEYGSRNAPSIKQLQDASQSNTELDFVGDKDTVFGRYARTATLEATSDRMTVLAKQNMSQIILNAKQNDLSPLEVSKQLDSVTSGLSSVLEAESPVTALKFKANTSIYANAEYKSYASTYITKKQKELEAQWSLNYENVLTNELPKLIENGIPVRVKGSVDEIENTATTRETLQRVKDNLLASRPIGMKSETLLAREKRFDDAVFEYAQDIVNNAIFKNDDPQKIIDALDSNKIEKLPMAIQSAFSVATGTQKAKLKKIAYDAIEEKQQRIQASINLKEKKRKLRIDELEISSSNALLNPDPVKGYDEYQKTITEMQTLNPKRAMEMREIVKENPEFQYAPFSDSTVFNSISMKFNERDVSLKQYQLNDLLLKRKLSKSDFDDFTEKLKARSNEDFNRALSYARSKLNLPKSFILGESKNVNLKYLKKIEEAMYKERAFNPDFLPMQWVEDNFDTYVANGKNVERQRIKQLVGDHFNLDTLNKKINRTPRRINDKPNPYYQKLIDEKNEIINWNRNNPDNEVTF